MNTYWQEIRNSREHARNRQRCQRKGCTRSDSSAFNDAVDHRVADPTARARYLHAGCTPGQGVRRAPQDAQPARRRRSPSLRDEGRTGKCLSEAPDATGNTITFARTDGIWEPDQLVSDAVLRVAPDAIVPLKRAIPHRPANRDLRRWSSDAGTGYVDFDDLIEDCRRMSSKEIRKAGCQATADNQTDARIMSRTVELAQYDSNRFVIVDARNDGDSRSERVAHDG